MATKSVKRKDLKSLPNRSDGVREMGNIRMKLMGRPICPVVGDMSDPQYEYQPQEWMGEPNCQTSTNNYPGWWRMCENKGHDPYHTVSRVVKKVPVLSEEDPTIIKGYQERIVINKRLNLVRVPIGTRFHSGRGEAISRGLKGRKSLTELGYNEKCQFRNCELDATVQSKYGLFCNERHARLIGADVETVFLHVKPGKREREQDFRNIDIEFDGVEILQSPAEMD